MAAGSSSSDAQSPQKGNGSSTPSQDDSPLAARAIESELAKALKDLDRGEKAASSLEDDLSKLEARLDEILAGLDPEVIKAIDATEAPPQTQEPQPDPEPKDEGNKK
ncbi:hypothetical protein GGTG_01523 [Gaeumannomyces tritici R3-111a-1]|uniref:Uncharacterized protein n=1 Tax=Gaeumannomyces tritici (strain R3-111a-1) TaxID=644352 RepID=J3NJU2_GAET3|nr:hypothetical protein GGTG_01523 [Gaeumannomyces tritici R3-111a-1]EJT81545.1 hypothetical protein GGTG_01523 [Gaeumannomyces tritici R3-111a-1]